MSTKEKLARFGRALALLLNRSLMYQARHQYILQSVADVFAAASPLLQSTSPVVLIFDRGQFFIDEEMLDPRLNVNRTAAVFKSSAMQSISFEAGLLESDLALFTEIFGSLKKGSTAEAIKEELIRKGVFNIKVNHVVFKKVTQNDQVVSREALQKAAPFMDSDDQRHRQKLMETLLESVLTEEFTRNLNIMNLMADPRAFTRQMIEADQAAAMPPPQTVQADLPCGTTAAAWGGPAPHPAGGSAGSAENLAAQDGCKSGALSGACSPDGVGVQSLQGAGGGGRPASGPGVLLLRQIEAMHVQVQKQLQEEEDVRLPDLAQAIIEMKKQLMEALQAQKALGLAYANEAAIIDAANRLTDQVLVELVKEEYRKGAVLPQRLAHLIVRLIPEAEELKRLLPQIKRGLLLEGMAPADYLKLIGALRDELQSEELARILQQSSESIGLDGQMLIEEVKRSPARAAELIYLASEIRKGGGDESAFSDMLVEYVERLGDQMVKDAGGGRQDSEQAKQVIGDVQSTLLKRLSGMNIDPGLFRHLEERLNARMETILDNMRAQWLQSLAGRSEKPREMTVLETLENNVGGDEELCAILRTVRFKAVAGDLEENNYRQIHAEILRQKQLLDAAQKGQAPPEGVLSSEDLTFFLEKEIARTRRYGSSFSALAFAFVKATPMQKKLPEIITGATILAAACRKLAHAFRSGDYIGQIGRNKMLALLPMAQPEHAKKALARVLRLMHSTPLEILGVPIQLRVAGVMAAFDPETTPDAGAFVRHLSGQLTEVVARIKSIQVLF